MRAFSLCKPLSHFGGLRAFHASVALLKTVPFKLADIGEGILKVEVLQVFVKEGDTVQEFDKICEVQSDKATVEITSRVSGVIQKLNIAQGQTALVGSVIADINVDGHEGHDSQPAPSVTGATPTPPAGAPSSSTPATNVAQNTASNGKFLATPATRRIAQENNVDLGKVLATGKGGRIMKEDVLKFLEGGQASSPVPSVSQDATAASPIAAVADRVIPLTGVRKAMVKSMTEANAIPSFGASDEIEITKLIQLRDQLKPLFAQRDAKLKLSFMPFFLKAASLALKQFPELNAYTNSECTEITVKGAHNIGFAMDSPNGLVVPNVKNVENKSIFDLTVEINALIETGKKNAFKPSDFQGGTFTLSNIGSIGATYTKPVIFPPQVAIGAIGKLQKIPRFDENDNVVKANIINVSWSADHRVVDGATMVRFNNLFKAYLENPALMLVDTK
eukprot:CAMPEP_0176456458 /NCGR_PEP_ID=MMETSP0127-20121128/31299_1 /TAXON_ID=938130 /ORGANISM="Platyophrya macrostoma, Strain WH" /LENGTH=447 /DNA_ID=CAMNT_0017846419 /DNA_START=48 /DNA_END=1391 /DNA_ORIENTATION=+